MWALGVWAAAFGAAALVQGAAKLVSIVLFLLAGMLAYLARHTTHPWMRAVTMGLAIFASIAVLVVVGVGSDSDHASGSTAASPTSSSSVSYSASTSTTTTSTTPQTSDLPPRPAETVSIAEGKSATVFDGDVIVGAGSVHSSWVNLQFTSGSVTRSQTLDTAERAFFPGIGRSALSYYSVTLIQIDNGSAAVITVQEISYTDYKNGARFSN